MNEFTNPAGNLGNNPFLQAPSTILPMKGKSSETGLAASISRPKSMIPVKRNRFDRYTAQQRMASADILNAHLLMVEIMMTNITQKYIYEVVSCLKLCYFLFQLRRAYLFAPVVPAEVLKKYLHRNVQMAIPWYHYFPPF